MQTQTQEGTLEDAAHAHAYCQVGGREWSALIYGLSTQGCAGESTVLGHSLVTTFSLSPPEVELW